MLHPDTHILPKASLGIVSHQSQNSWSGILASVQHCFLDMFSSCENRPVFVGFKGTRFRLNLKVEIKYIQMYHYTDKPLLSAITFGKNLTKKQVIYPNSWYMATFNINIKKFNFLLLLFLYRWGEERDYNGKTHKYWVRSSSAPTIVVSTGT